MLMIWGSFNLFLNTYQNVQNLSTNFVFYNLTFVC